MRTAAVVHSQKGLGAAPLYAGRACHCLTGVSGVMHSQVNLLMPPMEGIMRTLSMVTAGAILLAGCAATPTMHWTKPGASEEAFIRDHAACVQRTQLDTWSFYRGESFNTCMEALGYKEDPNGNLFPPPEQVATTAPAPIPAAVSAASEDYQRAVADYRNCLAANPKNANACEGQRHIMDADAQVLGGASQGAR